MHTDLKAIESAMRKMGKPVGQQQLTKSTFLPGQLPPAGDQRGFRMVTASLIKRCYFAASRAQRAAALSNLIGRVHELLNNSTEPRRYAHEVQS
jgi:hypothetical protein